MPQAGIIKIETTDHAIDRLVYPAETLYELAPKGMRYGLSEEEIKIVEGN